jgi:hypothetical protein
VKESAAALALMFVAIIAAAAGVVASGREAAHKRIPVAAVPVAVAKAPAKDWAIIVAPPASFTITITGHPDAALNGSATLTRSNTDGFNYGGYINGIQCLIYIEPSQNFLHFNAMRVILYDPPKITIRDSFRFIASAGSSPPQTGTFQLLGGGQIAISTP